MANKIRISVIVPIYGVERYIERCARSLFEQSLTEGIEFIFVNDATPDHSVEILEQVLADYPLRQNQTIILHNEKNSGVAVTRQRGMSVVRGDYVIHCDSDDWVEPNMYELMLQAAESKNADIVICDYYENLKTAQIHKKVAMNDTDTTLDFINKLILDNIQSFQWNKLVKRELYDKVTPWYIPGLDMLEDRTLLLRLAYYSTKNTYLQIPLYHYNKTNIQSYTTTWNDRHVQSFLNSSAFLEEFYKDKEFDTVPLVTIPFFTILLSTKRADRGEYLNLFRTKIAGRKINYTIFKTRYRKVTAWLLFNNHNILADCLITIKRYYRHINRKIHPN